MMETLNIEQKKFLEYLKKEYACLGYDVTIPDALKTNVYRQTVMNGIIADWKLFRVGEFVRIPTIAKLYNRKKPTNYLK